MPLCGKSLDMKWLVYVLCCAITEVVHSDLFNAEGSLTCPLPAIHNEMKCVGYIVNAMWY